jgi:hypothetical protein
LTLAYKLSFSLAVFYLVKRFYYFPKMLWRSPDYLSVKLIAIAWAFFSKVDEVAVAPGEVIPSKQVQ